MPVPKDISLKGRFSKYYNPHWCFIGSGWITTKNVPFHWEHMCKPHENEIHQMLMASNCITSAINMLVIIFSILEQVAWSLVTLLFLFHLQKEWLSLFIQWPTVMACPLLSRSPKKHVFSSQLLLDCRSELWQRREQFKKFQIGVRGNSRQPWLNGPQWICWHFGSPDSIYQGKIINSKQNVMSYDKRRSTKTTMHHW